MIGVEENEGCKPDPIMRKMASGLQPSNVISIIFPRACALGWYGAAPLALKDKKRPPEQLQPGFDLGCSFVPLLFVFFALVGFGMNSL